MIPTWKSMGSKSKLQAKGTASGIYFCAHICTGPEICVGLL
jgi:hypothetical protein